MSRTDKNSAYKNSKTSNKNSSGIKNQRKKPSPSLPTLKPVAAAIQQDLYPEIGVMAIDKLFLDLPNKLYGDDLIAVLERAQHLCKLGELGRGSTKSTFFKHAFVLKLPSGAVVRFHLVPNIEGKGAPMQIVLNPNQMEKGDSAKLKKVFKKLFPLDAREIGSMMLIRRIDVCIQFGLPIDDLIITMDGVYSGARIYVNTNRMGYVQTSYMGDVNSAHHGTAYDQLASDDYKRMVGEKPSREKLRDVAELILEHKSGRTRLESRRNFEKPVSLAELAKITTPFGKYRILQLKVGTQKWEPAFAGYLDTVRLRGMSGARAYIQELSGKGPAVTNQISDWERKLHLMAAPWWKPNEYAASLLETLRGSAAWKFLVVMEKDPPLLLSPQSSDDL